jgi:nucleotide-binding universal stress UspA family protein
VSEKVVRLSSVPVLAVRVQPDETLAFPYENVLVATDGSAASRRAADHTLSLATALDATVHVLSVVDDATLGADLRSTTAGTERERAATEAVETVVSEAETRGTADTVRHVEHGTPVEAIRGSIESNDVHVVGTGTTGRRATDRILLGGAAEKTVRSAPVSAMTVADPE